jgi:hypothetical protein
MPRKYDHDSDQYDPNGEFDDSKWMNPKPRRGRGKRRKRVDSGEMKADLFYAYDWAGEDWASNDWNYDPPGDLELEPWEMDPFPESPPKPEER